MNYLHRLAISIDQLLNVLVCNGAPDETMSSNCWRMEQKGRPWGFMRRVIDAIFFLDKDHCYKAFHAELQRRQMPRGFRK